MDGSGFTGFNQFLPQQPPQAGFQPAPPQQNMMQPGLNLGPGVQGMGNMPAVQSGYMQPGLDQGFQQPNLTMSGYSNSSFSAPINQPAIQQQGPIQSGYSDLSMGAIHGQTPGYQHPDVMQASMMNMNQTYTNHLAPPPWRTEHAQEIAEEGDNATTDALQLKGTSVFVAGLPRSSSKTQSTLDESTIRRFFSTRCGRVKRLRLQVSRGYCFVVFEKAEAASAAVALSGTDVILDSTSPDVTTRLVVKYAQDGDTNEPVYKRSAALRASVYTESAAKNVKEVLKSSEDMDEFYQAVCNVFSWLETGECTKRNCDQFLHMLQLMSGRASAFKEFDEERTQTRELEDLEWHGSMAHQCEGLRRTYEVANKQKVRDILSKPQRKSLDSWTNVVVEAAERFRKVFAAEANMEDIAGDDSMVPPPPPPAPPSSGGAKRTADAVALAEAEAKIQEQEEALRTARSRMNLLEQELKAKSSMGSAEYRVKSYEDEITSLKIQLKTSNGTATQKINNLEAKLAAMQKKLTSLQDTQKEWQGREKEWLRKEAAWEAKEREWKAKEAKNKASAEGVDGTAVVKEEGGNTATEEAQQGAEKGSVEGAQGVQDNAGSQAAGGESGDKDKDGQGVETATGVQAAQGDTRREKDQNGSGAGGESTGNGVVVAGESRRVDEREVAAGSKRGKEGSTAMEVDTEKAVARAHDDVVIMDATAPLSAMHACVAVCMAVYLISHPQGSTLSDLAEYLTKLSAAQKTMTFDAAIQLVLDTMQAIPGVFQQSPQGSGERIWSFVAYRTLAELWGAETS